MPDTSVPEPAQTTEITTKEEKPKKLRVINRISCN